MNNSNALRAIVASAAFLIACDARADEIPAPNARCNFEFVDAPAVAYAIGVTEERLQSLMSIRALSLQDVCNYPSKNIARALAKTDPNRPDQPDAAARFRALSLRDERGVIAIDGLVNAAAYRKSMVASHMAAQSSLRQPVAGISSSGWTALGPGNIGGRIRGMVIHPTNPNKMWVGATTGGIWVTSNAGASWSPINDFLPSMLITSMLLNPVNTNIMYAGTGECYAHLDTTQTIGVGVYKSTDAGATWNQLAATAPTEDYWRCVNRLAMHPTNPNILLAATQGQFSNVAAIWRSADAGVTWARVFEQNANSSAGVYAKDVAFDPNNGNKAVAGGNEGDIAYSTDAGLTWTKVLLASSGKRTMAAYSKSTPNIVYASVDLNAGSVYMSADGGATWTLKSAPGHLSSQGFHNNTIWVDPTNAAHVIVAGLDIYRSTDSAATFTKISTWGLSPVSPHADHHVILHDPGYNGTTNRKIYNANDGGVYVANDITLANDGGDAATNGWVNLNNNLAITQFYGGSGRTGAKVSGGTQDNGTLGWTGTGTNWTEIYGGDGGYSAIDSADGNYVYGEYVNLLLFRSTDGGATNVGGSPGAGVICSGILEASRTATTASPPGCGGTGQANFIAPFILDPNNNDRLLAGANSLWVSNNVKAATPTWAAIKAPSAASENYISAIAVHQGNPNIIWVGHNNGEIYRTSNGTTATPTWTLVSAALPARFATRIYIDKDNTSKVYITFGGYSAGNVQRTTDNGVTWTDISAGLPQAPIRGFARHPGNANFVYVGSEVGIFASTDGGTTWSTTNDGPGTAPVDELFWMDSTSLVAVTHGRGMYRATGNGGGSATVSPQSGIWWNPAEGGRGFSIEKKGNNLFMAAYLYDVSGRSDWYGAGPSAMNGASFTAPLSTYSGGQTLTGAYKSPTQGTSPGNLSVTFTDSTHGSLTWPGGTIPIERYAFVTNGLNLPPTASQPETGWWWNANEGGRGFSVEVQNGTAFIATYMYDGAGNPLWYLSGPSALTSGNAYQGTWTAYTGGQTLTGAYKSPTGTANAGNLTVQFTSSTAGTLTLPDGRQIPLVRFPF